MESDRTLLGSTRHGRECSGFKLYDALRCAATALTSISVFRSFHLPRAPRYPRHGSAPIRVFSGRRRRHEMEINPCPS